jgi:hypothetical protein
MDELDEFNIRIRRIAQLLSYEQDVSSYNSLEIAAAKLYLKDQENSEPSEISPPPSYH